MQRSPVSLKKKMRLYSYVISNFQDSIFASQVSQHLGCPLCIAQKKYYENGKFCIQLPLLDKPNVVLLIHRMLPSWHEDLFELFQTIDVIKTAYPRIEVDLLLTYFPYARQANTAVMLARLLNTLGIRKLFTIDLHQPQQTTQFQCSTYNIDIVPLWIQELKANLQEKICLFAADKSVQSRVEAMAKILKCAWGYAHKNRTSNGTLELIDFQGEVTRKIVYLIDDLVDTGKTLGLVASRLKESGACKVVALVTHGPYRTQTLEYLKRKGKDVLLTTNSLPIKTTKDAFIKIIPLESFVADVIKKSAQF